MLPARKLIVAFLCLRSVNFCYGALVSINLNYEYHYGYPDGYTRTILKVNGIFPGPNIIVSSGDTIAAKVTNNIGENIGLSVHWHGISQKSTPWADGTGYVTNCPITYGSSFTYKFNASEAGTFWYHFHVGLQRADGGYGFLIVKDKFGSEPASYDDERLLIVTDWYHTSGDGYDVGLLQYPGFIFPGVGSAVLLNGVGSCSATSVTISSTSSTPTVAPTSLSAHTPTLLPTPAPSSYCNQGKYSKIEVTKNKTYRLRILNAASLGYYNIAIAGHNMTVIQEDASPTAHVTMQSIDIGPGQRFDVLITTNQKSASYKIQVYSNWRGTDVTAAGGYFAYLTYSDSSSVSQLVPPNESKNWNGQYPYIKASTPQSVPDATREIILALSQQYVNVTTFLPLDKDGSNKNKYDGPLKWPINGVAFKMPKTPYLLASYYGLMDELYTMNASEPIKINYGEVVQLVIQNRVAGNGVCEQHPWHLHGYDFWVVGMGEGEYIPVNSSSTFNLIDPIKVDTVIGYPTKYAKQRNQAAVTGTAYTKCGWVAIRFVADNRGLWPLHCHIAWHQAMGMSVLFDVDSEGLWTSEGLELPDSYEYCGAINENTVNLRLASGTSSSSSSSSSSKHHLNKWEIVAIVFIIVLGALVIVLFTCLVIYKCGCTSTEYKEKEVKAQADRGVVAMSTI